MKRLIFVLLSIIYTFNLFSQEGMIGAFAGGSYYNGEVNQRTPFVMVSPAAGLVYQHNFTDRLTMRLTANYTYLRGSDAISNNTYQQWRNYSFRSDIWDLGAMIELHFLKFKTTDLYHYYYTPYFLIGAKMIIAKDANQTFVFGVPMGVGFKYLLTKDIVVAAEWIYHYTNSDELDLLPVDTHAQKQRSYNPNNDWYSYFGAVITFRLFKEQPSCPGI